MTFDKACEAFGAQQVALFDAASEVVVEAAASGLSMHQISALARAVAASGEKLDIPSDLSPMADVPSTGGPASLSTLLCPLLIASANIRVPKLSATGSIAGGIDTIGLVDGFNTKLVGRGFIEALRYANMAHAEPSENFCYADKFIVKCRRGRGMMANAGLAAASLLSKKLAIPGTHACFDFRVGATGNIGADFEIARRAGQLFYRAAKCLEIKIAVILTDNTRFPCSALGRLESLDLLWSIIAATEPSNPMDAEHLDTCVTLAAHACFLADRSSSVMEYAASLHSLLKTGRVRETFERHLMAQGTNLDRFHDALDQRARQSSRIVRASGDGFWLAPRIDAVKDWFKKCQDAIEANAASSTRPAAKQFGLRLLIHPGSPVSKDEPLIELRTPANMVVPFAIEFLRGSVSSSPISRMIQPLEHVSPSDSPF